MSSIDEAGASAAELVAAMAPLQQRIAAQQAELAALVAAFADRRTADDQAEQPPDSRPGPQRFRPGEFVADEVSLALTVSVWEARRLVARALRLRASMPTVWAAGLEGQLDQARLASIDAAARLILDEHVRAILDDTVVEVARAKTVKQLDGWLERFLAVQEPEAYTHRHQMTFAERNVSVRPGLEGVRFLSAMVSAPDAFLIDTRLDRLARSCGASDPRSMGQRRSDLFSDLLLDRVSVEDRPADADAGTPTGAVDVVELEVIDPDTGEYLGTRVQAIDSDGAPVDAPPSRTTLTPRDGVPVTMGVIVPLSTLTGDSELPGELADRSGCLTADRARELAAQPGTLFYRLLTDDRGHLLDVTKIGRFATGQLGFAVRLRTGTCGFPTCTVPADRCDLDHHEPVPCGLTTAANLDPASRRHHRAKTHGGFRSWRQDHETFWTTPTDHTYKRRDEPMLV